VIKQPDVDEMEDCSTKRSRMIERSICYFKTRGERRATKGEERKTEYNDVKGMKEESGGNMVDQFKEIYIIYERENFVFDSFIYLEPCSGEI